MNIVPAILVFYMGIKPLTADYCSIFAEHKYRITYENPPADLGICTLILFSCSKNNTKEETALKSSDTVMTVPPEKDDTPAEE